jgi:hypothetical protein
MFGGFAAWRLGAKFFMPLLTELGIFLRGGFLQRYRAYGAKRKSRPGIPQRLGCHSPFHFTAPRRERIVQCLTLL